MDKSDKAAKWREQVEELKQHIVSCGLSHRLDEIVALARNGIVLDLEKAEDEVIPIGQSRIGGQPDMPEDFEWPTVEGRPLSFIAQFNLEEVAPYDLQCELPEKGLLSFFYDAEEQPWGDVAEEANGWKVYYLKGEETNRLSRAWFPQGLKTRERFPSMRPSFRDILFVPILIDQYLNLTSEEGEAYFSLLTASMGEPWEQSYNGEPPWVLLGHRFPVQDCNIEADCAAIVEGLDEAESKIRAKDWALLLQSVSTGPGFSESQMCWGDLGSLYFLIEKQELTRRNFTRVWQRLECT